MPGGDHFFGGVGVDTFYTGGLGINNSFSEPEWNPSNIVSSLDWQYQNNSINDNKAPLPADFDSFTAPTPPVSTGSRPPPIEVSSVPPHMLNIPRPKSSPSTFGPNVEDLLFPHNPYNKYGGRVDDYSTFDTQFPLSPAKTPGPYFPGHEYQSLSARTSPALRHAPIAIAPHPMGMNNLSLLKRMRDGEEEYATAELGQRKRKRAVSNAGPVELNEEEQLLLKLKEEEGLPWKDIAVRFQSELGKQYQVPALQMRFKRLRERMRTWTETDISALEQAYEYWQKYQFDIISAKMLEYGASERWPAKYCARKWEELHPGAVSYSGHNFLANPWESEHCSPVESMSHSPRPSYGRSPRLSPGPRPSASPRPSYTHSPRPSLDLRPSIEL